MKQPRRSRDWQELQAQLGLAGFAMGTRNLLLEARANVEVRYRLPSDARLLIEQELAWLIWEDGQGEAPARTSPADRSSLPGFIRLGCAPDRAVVDYARSWGPLV
jgi:hypothetical protein